MFTTSWPLTLGAVGDASDLARAHGGRAARLRQTKSEIEQQLGDPDLSIGKIAARQRVPVRYLQRLFEADGAGQPIGHIAFEPGFANQSYFNRTFRSRYDTSPSDTRAQAQHDH